MPNDALLSVQELRLSDSERVLLNGLSLEVERGSIHALVGDHSSGKTSLAEAIAGLKPAFTGRLLLENRPFHAHSPHQASRHGIELICQSPRLIPSLNVFDNIFPRRRLKKHLVFNNWVQMRKLAEDKLRRFSVEVDLHSSIMQCSTNSRVLIYIIKSLSLPSKLLIVDEVTRLLTPGQIEILQDELAVTSRKGTTILYITRNVSEVHEFANRISFMQDGKVVETTDTSNLDKLELVRISYSRLHKRVELERENFELFYLKSFYEAIVDSLPMPVLITNPDGNIVYLNSAITDRIPVREEEIVNTNIREMIDFSPEERPLTGDRTYWGQLEIRKLGPTTLKVRQGIKIQSLYIIPIIDSENSVLGSMFLFDDTPDGVNVELKQQLIRLKRTIPFFAHEIRNPLSIIGNFLRLIRQEANNPEMIGYLSWIEKELNRVRTLVQRLVEDNSPADPTSNCSEVDPRLMVDEIFGLVKPSIGQKRITFINEADSGICLHHDEEALKEVLLNLIINAIEAIDVEGLITVTTERLSSRNGECVLLRVSDTGVGIVPGDFERLFTPFYTTKSGNEDRGLGLSICRDIVESWGGYIEVESTTGRGSTFSVHLPA